MPKKDFKGQTFGDLTVVKRTNEIKRGRYLWECECKCGESVKVHASELTRERYPKRHCGCGRYKDYSDLLGSKYGKLCIQKVYRVDDSMEARAVAVCDCGEQCDALLKLILRGSVKSCGCLREKQHADMIAGLPFVEGTYLNSLMTDKIHSNNKSGVRGVYWSEYYKRWSATLKCQGKVVLRKFFNSKEEAIQARKEAEEKYFKPLLAKYNICEKEGMTAVSPA